jgi:cytochrome P450
MGVLEYRGMSVREAREVDSQAEALNAARVTNDRPKRGGLELLRAVENNALCVLTDLAREHGDLVRVRLGLTPVVLVSHPSLVEEVLVTRNHDYRKHLGARRLSSLLGHGLLLSEGDFWLRQRRLMQPAFHRQRVARLGDAMLSLISDTLETWQDGETRDLLSDMTELTLRIAARTLFGSELADDVRRIRAADAVITRHFRSRLFSLMVLVPDAFPTPGNLRFRQAVRELDGLVYRIIAERRQQDEHAPDLLAMLLEARDDDGRGMTDRQLRDEIITLLLAGHETTAIALTWTFVLLAQHPSVAARLHQELDGVLGGRLPSVADVPRLAYTERVVNEVLRLYPPAWLIGREAIRDTNIGGQPVRKGTNVLVSAWVIQRDARFFPEPLAFQPERWEQPPRQRAAYLPFGGGQRICIGASFAQLETVLALAAIAQRFALELVAPAEISEPLPVVTLRPRGRVHVRVKQRERAA